VTVRAHGRRASRRQGLSVRVSRHPVVRKWLMINILYKRSVLRLLRVVVTFLLTTLLVCVDRKRLFIVVLPVRPEHSPCGSPLWLRRLFFYGHVILLYLCYIECLR
jgi:hypothetical protein